MANDKTGLPYRELGDLFFLPESQMEIITWTPASNGRSVPGEQVHLMFHIKEGLQFVVRLKSRAAVDRVIAILVDHRDSAMWET